VPRGRYDFWPQYAKEKDYYETNTYDVFPKRLAILLEEINHFTLDGNGSEFIMHDRIQPLTVERCNHITLKNFSIDWDIPLTSQAEIISIGDEYIDLKINTLQYPYIIENEKLVFTGEGWKSAITLAMEFNPNTGNTMVGGEAGAEAIVPLTQLWEKMTSIIKSVIAESQNGGAGNALSALVDKVGAAMQGSTQTPISGLLDRLSGGGNEPQPATANGAPINYAPVYNFNGAAPTKDDLVEAERMSQAEFNEMMEQWQRDNDRKRF